jgi:hypothetical protein
LKHCKAILAVRGFQRHLTAKIKNGKDQGPEVVVIFDYEHNWPWLGIHHEQVCIEFS